MKINILTLFPEMFSGFFDESIMKRAIKNKLIEVNLINIRDYANDKHQIVDDSPFGGGPGMVLKIEPLSKALELLKNSKVIYTSPQGKTLNQKIVNELFQEKEISIIAGRYEGIDERIIEKYVDMEISIGDFVLTGGEIPTMVIIDAVSRLIPGVLGNKASYEEDSFYNGLLDHPQYTRPAIYENKKVPDILLSGNHAKIDEWRLKQSLKRTKQRRPDLLEKRNLTKKEIKLLKEIENEK